MVLSETRGLWLSSIVRGGIGLRRRLSARRHEKPNNVTGYFTLETERLKNPTATARNGSPGMERTLSQRRSSCLLFQMFGVETYLLLPNAARGIRKNMPTPRLCRLRTRRPRLRGAHGASRVGIIRGFLGKP